MSFHLKTPQYSQLKQQTTLVCVGDHISHDDVLVTLDLFDTKQSLPHLNSQHNPNSCKGKQKRSLDDYNQRYYCEETMNRKNGKSSCNVPNLDLKLNLSPPSSRIMVNNVPRPLSESPTRSSASVSPPSSCVSSELSSPEACSMVLAGCPRCLMYVMLSEDDPKCPKCKSNVLLDFLHDDNNNNPNNNSNNNNNSCSNSSGTKKSKKG